MVDISARLPIKMEEIRAYASQFSPAKERVFQLVEGLNRVFGVGAGFEAGELLIGATTIGIRDLVATLCPAQKSA